MKNIIWLFCGFTGVALGTVGVILPVLPTVPFYLFAAFCFGKSSKKLHTWFVNTGLYKNNLESYVKGDGMTLYTKVRIISLVTIMMGIGFFMMIRKCLYIPCIILVCVWIAHIVYFVFRINTIKSDKHMGRGEGCE